jgi:hypothetical protein
MAKSVYALLVGVDEYEGRAPTLQGCKADVQAFRTFLEGHVPPEDLHVLALQDQQATRQGVIDGFTRHFADAGPDDAAVFYYSGHGSTEAVEKRFWYLEPTGEQQTIVCFDSRKPGVPDLADKEINELIGGVSARGPHMLAIFDCCHSGGAMRAVDVRVRAADPVTTPRAVDEFLPGVRDRLVNRDGGASTQPDAWDPPRQVALAACESLQLSKELRIGRQQRGIFSAMLERALTTLGPGATYRDLLGAASAGVRDKVLEQDPVGYSVPVEAIDQPLFGGVVRLRDHAVTLEHVGGTWSIDAGTVHGIQGPVGDDTTVLAVLPPDGTSGTPDQAPLGRVRVTSVEPSRSRVEVDGTWQPERGIRYPTVVVDVPTPPATVELRGETGAVARVRAALAGSPHVRESSEDPGMAGDRFLVLAEADAAGHGGRTGLVVARADGTPLAAPVPPTDEGAATVVRRLEHLARWHLLKRLDNPGSSIAGTIGIEIVPAQKGEPTPPPRGTRPPITPGEDGRVHLHYSKDGGAWQAPYVWIYLHNDSSRDLYCTLLDLTDRYRCHSRLFPGALLPAGAVTVAFDGRPVDVSVPKERLGAQDSEVLDWMKLVACEQRFAPGGYELPNLDGIIAARSATRAAGPRSVLDRLADRVVTRDAGDDGDEASTQAPEWTTALVTLRTFGPTD